MSKSAPSNSRYLWERRWRSFRPRWTVVLASALLLGCLWMFVGGILQINSGAQKVAIVDMGVSNSVAELSEAYAKQAMAIQSIRDLAADGQQSITPAWRSVAITFQRCTQALDSAIRDTQERVQIAEQYGLNKGHLETRLFEFEQLRSSLQDDVNTIIRLTDEGRSSDIATMHESISDSVALVQEQVDTLHQYSQIAILSSTKKIQQGCLNILFAGLGSIVFSTFICVKLWSKRPTFSPRKNKTADSTRQDDYSEITTEQALTERFLLRGVHVLVAEDDVSSRRLLAKIFENAGAVVTVACDGVQALSRFRKSADSGHPVQMIILDIMMPDCDGLQVASQVREFDQFTGPILGLTAVPETEMRTSCLEAGIDDFLSKPIDRTRLLKLATDYLGKSVTLTS